MNIEEVDGFFAALIVGPDVVMPSGYLPDETTRTKAREIQFGLRYSF